MNRNRRQFGMTLGALGAGLSLPAWAATAGNAAGARRLIKPPRLQPGALIGLVAPSGVENDAGIEAGVRNLESLGFKVKLGRNIRAARGGYAGTVAERVADLHAMFHDREVQAIWAARGGSGASALLPHLDYALMRSRPKILIGYSDITALHLAIYRRAGLVTFHGPVGSSTFSDYTVNHMLSVLMEPQREYAIHQSIENERKAVEQPQFAMRVVRPGVACGRLIGGNLSLVAALAGTPYAADIRDSLLFLEEVDEEPYRVDRMLTQLQQNQPFGRAAGVMLGVFQKGAAKGNRQLTMSEVLDDHFAALKIPSVYGYSFGHIPHQMTLPVGLMARLDTEDQTLTLLEAATT
ncbi:MAG: LD-carboxypeptidase [Betaproteobacteria bacterium]|nr:LD-carboxypeptidase [Betaproteobacteria bacterium]